MWFGRCPRTFRRNILLSSSGLKNMPSNKPVKCDIDLQLSFGCFFNSPCHMLRLKMIRIWNDRNYYNDDWMGDQQVRKYNNFDSFAPLSLIILYAETVYYALYENIRFSWGAIFHQRYPNRAIFVCNEFLFVLNFQPPTRRQLPWDSNLHKTIPFPICMTQFVTEKLLLLWRPSELLF